MNRLKIALLALMTTASFSTATAGGLLTNTNQNIAFLRNPARDGAIGIDGVYSNPAGVAFLRDGFHLSLNIQNAHQTRTIDTEFPLFIFNANNPGSTTHHFKGTADVPVLPSIQAAYNKNRWSFQFNFAVTGGGGKCEFADGLGSFEKVVSGMIGQNVATVNGLYQKLAAAGIPGMGSHQMGNGYAYDSYMRGRQYYFGFTFGAAYRLTDNLAVYGGLRMLYGNSNYYGYVKNINVEHIENGVSQMVNAPQHFTDLAASLNQIAGMMGAGRLILLSNIDGLYDGNPLGPTSRLVRTVYPGDEPGRFVLSSKSSRGRGGMSSKCHTAMTVAGAGIDVVIANGLRENILPSLLDRPGETPHTHFIAS